MARARACKISIAPASIAPSAFSQKSAVRLFVFLFPFIFGANGYMPLLFCKAVGMYKWRFTCTICIYSVPTCAAGLSFFGIRAGERRRD